MADDLKVAIAGFEPKPSPHHVVEVEQGGQKRRVKVSVAEGAWTGLGWFGSPQDGIERVVLLYVREHAAKGTLQDENFVSDDEAASLLR